MPLQLSSGAESSCTHLIIPHLQNGLNTVVGQDKSLQAGQMPLSPSKVRCITGYSRCSVNFTSHYILIVLCMLRVPHAPLHLG